jgi:hypothetical protein
LRAIGWVKNTLFFIGWLIDPDMPRRARIGLTKNEAYHALKNALRIDHQGEIRDRTTEGQSFGWTSSGRFVIGARTKAYHKLQTQRPLFCPAICSIVTLQLTQSRNKHHG